MTHDELIVYVIYDHPTDYPDSFVVRRWEVVRGIPVPLPNANPVLAKSLREARNAVPAGTVNIGRSQQDDAAIVEVWM